MPGFLAAKAFRRSSSIDLCPSPDEFVVAILVVLVGRVLRQPQFV